MSFSRESAVNRAKEDLAERLGIPEGGIESSVSDADFPNSSLGAPVKGEMSSMMVSSGWKIKLKAAGKEYEYRADKYQLRLHGLKGKNLIIES